MSNVSEWSTAAGSNNSAPPDGAPENMLPGKVNDCMREMMAALAKWYQDARGVLDSTGASSDYAVTTNAVYTSFSDIPLLAFRANHTNDDSATLNVDGLGAKTWRRSTNGSVFEAGQILEDQVNVVVYNSDNDEFYQVGPAIENAAEVFASGTVMLFAQTAAPTGWTKGITHNNKALRLVTGTASSGGSTAFTSVFTSRTIAQANLPNVNFTNSLTAADHTHGAGSYAVGTAISNGTTVLRNQSTNNNLTGGGGGNYIQSASSVTVSLTSGTVTGTSDLSGSLAVTGTVASGGSGTAMDFDVQYVDVIMATKD